MEAHAATMGPAMQMGHAMLIVLQDVLLWRGMLCRWGNRPYYCDVACYADRTGRTAVAGHAMQIGQQDYL